MSGGASVDGENTQAAALMAVLALEEREPDLYVGTSKTIRSLARLAGAAPSGEGPYVRRTLERADLKKG